MKKVTCLMNLLLAISFLVGLAEPAEKTTIGTPIRGLALMELPMMAAEEKGYWRENGLEGEWVPLDSGAALVKSMAAGAVDFSTTMLIGILPAVARGVRIIMVADIAEKNDFHVWVKPDSPIKGPRELKGTRIGVAALGGAAQFMGAAAFKSLGIEKDVKFVGMGGARAGIAGLKAGTIEGWILAFHSMAPLIARREVRSVVNVGDFMPKDWVNSGLLARLELVENAPAKVKGAVRAYFQALNFIMDNPDWVLAKLKAKYTFGEDVARIIYDGLKYSRHGKINPKAVENVRNFAIEYELVPKDKVPPVEKLFTSKFTE